MTYQVWTPQDIQELSQGYYEGSSLKELSLSLNRSVSALNKALNRFGIRKEKNSLQAKQLENQLQGASKDSMDILLKRSAQIVKKRYYKDKKIYMKRKKQQESSPLLTPQGIKGKTDCLDLTQGILEQINHHLIEVEPAQWVTMPVVVSYLRQQKYFVSLIKTSSNVEKLLYLINSEAFTSQELLKKANLYRMNQNKSPFYVRGITW